MPLDAEKLKVSIATALAKARDNPESEAIDIVAADLANAIQEFVKTGDVVGVSTSVSVQVNTTGTAAAQTGTGSGTGTQSNKGGIE